MHPHDMQIRLRSRPIVPGGEGAGADHPWDTVHVDRMGEALDYVRADASPRIWTTDGEGFTPKLWAHLDGVAVSVDRHHQNFHAVGWVDGWAQCDSAYGMMEAVLDLVPLAAIRRAAIRAARVVAHFAESDATHFLDAVEAWNDAGAPMSSVVPIREKSVALGQMIDVAQRGSVDQPDAARRAAALHAALFAFDSGSSPYVFANAGRALLLLDEVVDDGGMMAVRVDNDSEATRRCLARFADIVRNTITLDMVVEGLIARKREARAMRTKPARAR